MSDFKKLSECKSVNAKAKKPTLAGQNFVARVIAVTDADTITVARLIEGKLERLVLRVALLDSAEVKHKKGKQPSRYEQILGCLGKNILLHTMLPEAFEILPQDDYNFYKQIKPFEDTPVIVKVSCPLRDSKGKLKQEEPYGRTISSVAIMKSEQDSNPIDIASIIINKGLGDVYEGGTKERSFMKSTSFVQEKLQPLCGSTICNLLLESYKEVKPDEM